VDGVVQVTVEVVQEMVVPVEDGLEVRVYLLKLQVNQV
jgi:hypothetical protein